LRLCSAEHRPFCAGLFVYARWLRFADREPEGLEYAGCRDSNGSLGDA
jgi:hypothetical protein